MTLPIWWQIATLHKDIREGRLSEAVFAADLGDVLSGRGPEEYRDPRLFFKKTYLTKGLENLILNVLSRLTSGKGDAVIQLQTPFGGGKTHALLALYHLAKNFDEIKSLETVSNLLKSAGLADLKDIAVAAFVGTHADPLKGRTPWGEIAHQLGCYDVVKEHDQRRISPGKERINEILGRTGPTLILIDEILQYIVKANQAERSTQITEGQTLAFVQELSEAVGASPNCALVLTLPASVLEQYDVEAEKAWAKLQKILGRVETIYTPVEGIEIYEVIRKRLFEDLGEEESRKEVAEWYFELYQRLGNDVPPEVRGPEYRHKIERAYPFHPELIDMLYERWGSIPTFQRTRGVLRLLAGVVQDLYKRKIVSPLIQSSLVNLGNQTIRREFIKHIGNEYETVIAADIAGVNAKAPQIDREMGSEYEKYGIANGIATSVFLYSFSGAERKGITLPRLRVCALREGIPLTIVGDAVSKLEGTLWYFHSEGQLFAFKNQPNLNRVIVDQEETIADEEVESALRDFCQNMIGKEFDVYFWPKSPSDIPDSKNTKLVILSPDFMQPSMETKEFAEEIFTKAGMGFRAYKNNLFILAMDVNQYQVVRNALKRYLALSKIEESDTIRAQLSKENLRELSSRLKEVKDGLPFKILTAYRHIGVLETGGISWLDLGIPTIGRTQDLTARVKEYLRDQEKILSRISPKYILEKTFGDNEEKKSLQEIWDIFLKTPGLPLLEDREVLAGAVREGVRMGIIGARIEGKVYLNEQISFVPEDIDILRPEKASREKEKKAPSEETPREEYQPLSQPTTSPIVPEDKPSTHRGFPFRLYIKAKIPWDKMSQLISGVILPLKDRGAEPEIFIELRAESKEGFDRTTLDIKVKETLQQVGAEIKEWEEE